MLALLCGLAFVTPSAAQTLTNVTVESSSSATGTYSTVTLTAGTTESGCRTGTQPRRSCTPDWSGTVAADQTHVKITSTVNGGSHVLISPRGQAGVSGATEVQEGRQSHAIELADGVNVIFIRTAWSAGNPHRIYRVAIARPQVIQPPPPGTVSISPPAEPVQAEVTLAADKERPTEGETVTITATIDSPAPAGNAALRFKKRSGTADFDNYSGVEGIVVIAEGETEFTKWLRVHRDSLEEAEETIVIGVKSLGPLTLTNDPTLTLTILDGDPLPTTPTTTTTTGGPGGGGGGGGGGGLPPPVSGNEPPPSRDEEPSTPCPRGDREILRNFYQMTNGEGWDRHENWNSDEPLGEWHGVKTDEDGKIVSLRLADNGLSGNMPARELRCLSELVELALWDNDDLSGEVPDELVLAVERAALRYLAETLDINPGWFEDYEDPYDFEDWHEGVTIDDDGRVTEIDLTGERVTGEIPENIRELLPRLGGITVTRSSEDGGCALSPEDGSSAFGLFLLALLVFAVLVRKRARG